MFKHYFEQIENVAVWPVVSLTIFFLFFLFMGWYVWKMEPEKVGKLKQLPLEGEEEECHAIHRNDQKS